MPTAPLIGKVATPEFNILGLLMGGPKYMSQYMGAKDQATQAQQQMGLNAQYAQDLIKRPDFQGAFQPRDQPYINLWASMQGGTPQVGALGNSLMESGIQQGLGRDMAKFQQGITQENAKLGQTIEQQNMQKSADIQLQTAGLIAQQQADFRAKQTQTLFDPKTPQITKDVITKQLGIYIPAGTSIVTNPDGSYSYQANMGGPAYQQQLENHQKMLDQLQPIQELQTGLQNLADMNSKGTGSYGEWESQSGALEYSFAKILGAGAMQQADVEQIRKLIPGYYDNVNARGQTNIVGEKLKQTMRLVQGKQQLVEQKWFLKPNEIPNASKVERPPPPTESPLAKPATVARDAMSPRAEDRPSATLGDVIQGGAKTIWDSANKPAVPLRRGR